MKRLAILVSVVAMSATLPAWAQPGGRGGFGSGFGGGGLLDLARMEAVQKDIEAIGEQIEATNKLAEQMRASRGEQQRPDFRNLSEAEREKMFAEMRARREKEAEVANAKLAEIYLPHQMERLEQISLQVRGTGALSDPKVAAKLELTDVQKKRIEAEQAASRDAMQQAFQGARDQDRDQMRQRMQQLRQETEAKMLAVLTNAQKAEFEKMKGQPFTMPEVPARAPQGGQDGQRGQRGQRGGNR